MTERATEVFVGELVIQRQFNYDQFWKVWVFKDYNYASKCMSLVNYRVIEQKDCDQLLPAVCERGKNLGFFFNCSKREINLRNTLKLHVHAIGI